MSHTENLLKSIEPLKNKFKDYYDELYATYSAYSKFDFESVEDYVKDVFNISNRAFFTICSKESFNNLESERNWIDSIIYSPLNDHSRPFMKKGDIVFCYRQGQFSDLKEALKMRGIYGLGFVASEPKILFPQQVDHNKYGVAILFPFGMKQHLELRNIQLNPVTISLTPYNGNRNDALQYIPEYEYSKSLLEQICRKNSYLRKPIENVIGKKIEDKLLPDEVWNLSSTYSDNHIKTFSQTIYYGVPGCGKSHSISKKLRKLGILKSDECNFTKRVVFHPEYTNADFIGQILPETNEGKTVSYPFKAGPFTEILAQAYTHKNQNYALVIEEINRGNAAAIFGELFQLLDRLDKTENESSNGFTYTAGWSSYPVNNDNINKAIQEAYSKSDIEPFLPKEIFEKYKLNVGIRLPPNLSLLATMNTSDQNVFVLDNAFQRRWNMELVPNVFSDTEEEKNQRDAILEGSSVTWETFQTKINQTIAKASKDSGFSSMVDKRLGCWFVKAEKSAGVYVINKEAFKNKILKYLWDDAFKFDRENYFVDADSFEDLQNKVSMSEKNFGVFKEIEFAENI